MLRSSVTHAFTPVHSQDAGGWSNHGAFDAALLAGLPRLRDLTLGLRTWGCEHADALELQGLDRLTQLRRLVVTVTGAPAGLPQAMGGGGGGLQEVRLALPVAAPVDQQQGSGCSSSGAGAVAAGLEEVLLACSGAMVVRNCRTLARARRAAALARAVLFEEDAPGDQHAAGSPAAVRGPAAAVVAALPELWPATQVWRVPLTTTPPPPASGRWWWRPSERAVACELLCGDGEGCADESLAALGAVMTDGLDDWKWGKANPVCRS
jgi:hypothetical protein